MKKVDAKTMHDAIIQSYEDCGTGMNFIYAEKNKLKEMTPMVLFLQCYNSYCQLAPMCLTFEEGTYMSWRSSRIHTDGSDAGTDTRRTRVPFERDEKKLLCDRNCQELSLLYSMIDFSLYFGKEPKAGDHKSNASEVKDKAYGMWMISLPNVNKRKKK